MNSNKPSPGPAKKPGDTQATIAGDKAPRMPHEHDESADSSGQQPQGSTKQAYADVKRGLVDTDKGPPMDQAYKKQQTGKTKSS